MNKLKPIDAAAQVVAGNWDLARHEVSKVMPLRRPSVQWLRNATRKATASRLNEQRLRWKTPQGNLRRGI